MIAAINPNIDAAYWWLTFATVPMWGCALWWNIAAVKRGVVEGVRVRAATAVLAFIYLVGQLVLLFSTIDPAGWSDVMRGFQLLSIPIVWTAPARFSVQMADKIRAAAGRVTEKYDGDA